jgi:glycosyltransferase involved in cell wall biosynthesis
MTPVVCHLAGATHLGGAERSMLELTSALRRDGHWRPVVLLPRARGPLADALDVADVPRLEVAAPASWLRLSRATPASTVAGAWRTAPAAVGYLTRLRSTLRASGATLLHTNGVKPHLLGALCSLPLLWHLRDILPPGPVVATLRRLARLRTTHVVAVSHAAARALGEMPSLTVIHDGIDVDAYAPAPHRRWHRRLGLEPSTPLVGMVGVLARWKGQLTFVRAAQQLIAAGCRAHFAIFGDHIYDSGGEGDFKGELVRAIARAGLEERVHLLGFHPDPAGVMNGLDLVVHASEAPEPFGRVLVEAMACGVPVVAAGAGGALEIVRDGATALTHRPGDATDLARAMSTLLADAALCRRLVAAGREDVARRFSLAVHAAKMTALYERIVA